MYLSCDKSRTIKMFLGTTYSVWNYVPYKMNGECGKIYCNTSCKSFCRGLQSIIYYHVTFRGKYFQCHSLVTRVEQCFGGPHTLSGIMCLNMENL